MKQKYWYNKMKDEIEAVRYTNRSIHMAGDELLFKWITSTGVLRLFNDRQQKHLLKDSPEELFQSRMDYLDSQIDKYERRKILQPEVIEFKD